ncbi:hypothetical protein M422DRAFT_267292 [Sphaerobolus stellatus SS14]|uniref:Uncharacterized protein n=1 Tax=Sphaerobolus stellatus (strain SS14) TaxID=990650 RepID=A0A0C9V0C9_SPHS4|nr:hypothetical protein M422DRAFT_267292 [Sphaerobolus stellatus SS14]
MSLTDTNNVFSANYADQAKEISAKLTKSQHNQTHLDKQVVAHAGTMRKPDAITPVHPSEPSKRPKPINPEDVNPNDDIEFPGSPTPSRPSKQLVLLSRDIVAPLRDNTRRRAALTTDSTTPSPPMSPDAPRVGAPAGDPPLPGLKLPDDIWAHFVTKPVDGWPTIHSMTQDWLLRTILPHVIHDWHTLPGEKVVTITSEL